jgi:protein-disulfide isomerase-like protein with CxxC motif
MFVMGQKGLNAQEERRNKIRAIQFSIKTTYANGGDIEREKFIFEIQQMYGCSESKANEYFKEALTAHEYQVKQRIEQAMKTAEQETKITDEANDILKAEVQDNESS